MRVFAPIARLPRRHVGAALLSLATLGLSSCLDLNPNVEACSVTVAPTNITVPVNGRQLVAATAFDCKGNSIRNKKISYSTAQPSIATVGEDGTVIGISVGQTTVSAVANDKSATAQVTVTPEVVASVSINPPTATLRKTNTRTFQAVLRNSAGTVITKPVRWSSSNTAVASVDQNGVVTALLPGQVQIVAEVDQVLGTSTVTVTEIPIQSCSLSPATQRVTVSAQTQPTLTLRDSTQAILVSTGRLITWTSDNEVVATVSQTGLVSARRAGTARISALSSENPTVGCQMTIDAVDARVAQVVIQQRTGSLRIGIPKVLTVAIFDSVNNQLTGRQVTWIPVTPSVGSITNLGVVTGIALGNARFAVNVEGVVDTVSFPVTKVPIGLIRVTPIQATIKERETRQFTATVEDSTGAIVTDRVLEWVTSDPTRARVTQTGLVEALSFGVVSVFATGEGRSGQSELIITPVPVDTILAPTTFVVAQGNTSAFTMSLRDAAGNELLNRVVRAVSARPDIAQVSAFIPSSPTVVVQAFNVGTTTITLQALNTLGQAEGKPTVVQVTVTPRTTSIERP